METDKAPVFAKAFRPGTEVGISAGVPLATRPCRGGGLAIVPRNCLQQPLATCLSRYRTSGVARTLQRIHRPF